MEKAVTRNRMALVIDQLTFSLLLFGLSFVTVLLWLRRFMPSVIIAGCVGIAAFTLLVMVARAREQKRAAAWRKEMGLRLKLERMLLMPTGRIPLEGYQHLSEDIYLSKRGEKMVLLHLHPSGKATASHLIARLRGNRELQGFLSTAPFDEEATLLAGRLGLALIGPKTLVKLCQIGYTEEELNQQIHADEQRRKEQKKQLRKAAFQKTRAKKYLMCALFLFALSFFMGGFQRFYLSFALFCVTLSGVATALGQGQ